MATWRWTSGNVAVVTWPKSAEAQAAFSRWKSGHHENAKRIMMQREVRETRRLQLIRLLSESED
jgi:hypothetical protein